MKPYRDAVNEMVFNDLAHKYSNKVVSASLIVKMNQLILNAADEER